MYRGFIQPQKKSPSIRCKHNLNINNPVNPLHSLSPVSVWGPSLILGETEQSQQKHSSGDRACSVTELVQICMKPDQQTDWARGDWKGSGLLSVLPLSGAQTGKSIWTVAMNRDMVGFL